MCLPQGSIHSTIISTLYWASIQSIAILLANLLYRRKSNDNDKTIMNAIIYFLWDKGWESSKSNEPKVNGDRNLVCLSSLIGSWFGAILVPLDWDKWYQTYPTSCILGCIIGFSISNIYVVSRRLIRG